MAIVLSFMYHNSAIDFMPFFFFFALFVAPEKN